MEYAEATEMGLVGSGPKRRIAEHRRAGEAWLLCFLGQGPAKQPKAGSHPSVPVMTAECSVPVCMCLHLNRKILPL